MSEFGHSCPDSNKQSILAAQRVADQMTVSRLVRDVKRTPTETIAL